MNKINKENFWFNNYYTIVDPNKVLEFVPSKVMNIVENMNAILRLSIYVSIILAIYKKNINWLLFPIIIALLTIFFYKFSDLDNILKNTKDFKTISNYNSNKDNSDSGDDSDDSGDDNSNDSGDDNSDDKSIEKFSSCIKNDKETCVNKNCVNKYPQYLNPFNNSLTGVIRSYENNCNKYNYDLQKTYSENYKKIYCNGEDLYNRRFDQRHFYTMPCKDHDSYRKFMFGPVIKRTKCNSHPNISALKICQHQNK